MSGASRAFTDRELTRLLQQARHNNEQHQITGALVYGDGQFMQVLEGERDAVRALCARIARDGRYQEVFKLCDESIAQRNFAEWSIAFQAIAPAELARRAGYKAPQQLLAQLPIIPGAEAILIDLLGKLLLAPAAPALLQ